MPLTVIRPPRVFGSLDVAELWAYRELLYFLVWRDLKVRYKQTVVGMAWAVIQPFGTMVVFSLFFGGLAKIPSDGLPYPIFFYSALVPWMYFAAAVQSATNVMVEHQRIITKVYFPRVLLPVAAVLSGLVDFAIAGVVLVAMALYYGIVPGTAALTLPLFVLLAMLTALGVGLWLSALNVMYRDVRYVLPFLIQFWMFVSPVAYPSSLVPEPWRWLYGLNPMAGVIEAFRGVFSGAPAPAVLGASAVAMVVVLAAGVTFFQSVEGTLVDVA
jgi:lipopolysaccharide transport system permease protein